MEGNYIPGCTPGRLHQVHRLSPIDFEFSITEFKLVICSIFLVLVDWYLGGGGMGIRQQCAVHQLVIATEGSTAIPGFITFATKRKHIRRQ